MISHIDLLRSCSHGITSIAVLLYPILGYDGDILTRILLLPIGIISTSIWIYDYLKNIRNQEIEE